MSMTRHMTAAAAAALLLAAPAVGGAQTSQTQAAPAQAQTMGDGAIAFGADAGEATETGYSLRGRAEVVQGTNRLRANAITIQAPNGDFQRVEASGEVYFVTPEQTIRGDRAVYTLASNEVVVTGDVILTQGQNVLTGGRLVYNTRTRSARMDSGGGRIRGVFYPNSTRSAGG